MSGAKKYLPNKGDIVLLDFNPSSGIEIKKRRPALVISNQKYAQLTGLAVVCPISHASNNRLVEVGLFVPLKVSKISGVVNPLQFHTYNFGERKMEFVEKVSNEVLAQVLVNVNDVVNAK